MLGPKGSSNSGNINILSFLVICLLSFNFFRENGKFILASVLKFKKQKKITHPEKNYYIFFKKSHTKQISYTFLKIFWTQMVFISYILEKLFLYSSSRKVLYRSRLAFFFLFLLTTHKHIDAFCLFFLQKSSGTFHVLLFEALFAFLIIVIRNFYI